jgi:hypothetical protein
MLASSAGLPDGIFSNQNPILGKFMDGLRMENLGIFFGHLKYLHPFGKFNGN